LVLLLPQWLYRERCGSSIADITTTTIHSA